MLRDTVVGSCQVRQPDRSVEVTRQSFATTADGLGQLAAGANDPPPDAEWLVDVAAHGMVRPASRHRLRFGSSAMSRATNGRSGTVLVRQSRPVR